MGFGNEVINPCVLSSTIFLTNAYTAYTSNKITYCLLFIMLSVSSVIHHYDLTNQIKEIIDKICVYIVVSYGLYTFINQTYSVNSKIIIILLFLATIVLYHYGNYTCTLCFDPDEEIQYYYHVLLHIIASLGHHLILWLKIEII